ncbi:MAG: DoxX family protein [Acidimicrobiia bacterium]
MSTAFVVVNVLLAVALAFSATFALIRHERVLTAMARAGVPPSRLPLLGSLKAAGAIGLLVGLAVPWIGRAAGIGVVLYFLGAIITHLRARDYTVAPASAFSVLAVSALVLGVAK